MGLLCIVYLVCLQREERRERERRERRERERERERGGEIDLGYSIHATYAIIIETASWAVRA